MDGRRRASSRPLLLHHEVSHSHTLPLTRARLAWPLKGHTTCQQLRKALFAVSWLAASSLTSASRALLVSASLLGLCMTRQSTAIQKNSNDLFGGRRGERAHAFHAFSRQWQSDAGCRREAWLGGCRFRREPLLAGLWKYSSMLSASPRHLESIDQHEVPLVLCVGESLTA